MSERTWDDFLRFLYGLPGQLKPGRQRIRVVRDNLEELIAERVLPALNPDEHSDLFPLGYSPVESDLKLVAGIGMERGLITAEQYEASLRADKAAGPFGFLQSRSGKVLGETVAPLIAEFWLCLDNDSIEKMPNTSLFDLSWNPSELGTSVRIELKASAEANPRFQQIRHPWMVSNDRTHPDYDILLCLGLSNEGLEWWAIPAQDVATMYEVSSVDIRSFMIARA